MLLRKLLAAGIGDRPVVFVTHRYMRSFLSAYVQSYSLLT